jgi:hypothetical protein
MPSPITSERMGWDWYMDESLRNGVKQSEGAKSCDGLFETVQRADSVRDY